MNVFERFFRALPSQAHDEAIHEADKKLEDIEERLKRIKILAMRVDLILRQYDSPRDDQ